MGGGVIEVTHSVYNFGSHRVDFHNVPWGGVRKTIFNNILVSNPGGGFTDRPIVGFGIAVFDTENRILECTSVISVSAAILKTDSNR